MVSESKNSRGVYFVLLTMLQSIEKSVSIRCLQCDPPAGRGIRWTETCNHIDVPVIRGYGDKRVYLRMKMVSCSQVERVVPLQHVKGAPIDLNAIDRLRNENVDIGITVAVRVGGEIVRGQISANAKILRDRFAVISGHAGNEILRRLDSAGSRLDGKTGDGNWSTGVTGIGVE